MSQVISRLPPTMNPWETQALHYHFDTEQPIGADGKRKQPVPVAPRDSVHDPVIYPGIYAPSGFDIMSIMFKVMGRQNQQIKIGPVDDSCALLLCDLQQEDCPVVYASEAFSQLTGYHRQETIGRNCRFLQAPGGCVRKDASRRHVPKDAINTMRHAIKHNEELYIEVLNFKKNGQKFLNGLTIIPICWDSTEPRYSVGFQAEISR